MHLHLKYSILILLFLFSLVSVAQDSYVDKISGVIKNKSEGQYVLLTGKVLKWIDEDRFTLQDETGEIDIYLNGNSCGDLLKDDYVTMTGEIQKNSQGKKEIAVISLRKSKYLKNPANCCRPETD